MVKELEAELAELRASLPAVARIVNAVSLAPPTPISASGEFDLAAEMAALKAAPPRLQTEARAEWKSRNAARFMKNPEYREKRLRLDACMACRKSR